MRILEVRYSHSQKYTYDLVIIVYAEYKRFSLRQIYKIKLPYDNNRKFTVIFLYSWYYANIPDIRSLLVTQIRDLVKRSARIEILSGLSNRFSMYNSICRAIFKGLMIGGFR